jgi:catechol 2,3-dioxygenase-like lactoylglutathione lyase family enzyme
MKATRFLLITGSLLIASAGLCAEATKELPQPPAKPMNAPAATLGYVVLYVRDVAASLAFYEEAFGLTRRFFNDDQGKAYGELKTGAARLAFYNFALARTQFPEFTPAAPDKAPPDFEIALVTADVPALFARAVKAGAKVVSEPATKPWGQTTACVRDKDGHTVSLCTPLP